MEIQQEIDIHPNFSTIQHLYCSNSSWNRPHRLLNRLRRFLEFVQKYPRYSVFDLMRESNKPVTGRSRIIKKVEKKKRTVNVPCAFYLICSCGSSPYEIVWEVSIQDRFINKLGLRSNENTSKQKSANQSSHCVKTE